MNRERTAASALVALAVTVGWMPAARADEPHCAPPFSESEVADFAPQPFELQLDADENLERGVILTLDDEDGKQYALARWQEPDDPCPRYADGSLIFVGVRARTYKRYLSNLVRDFAQRLAADRRPHSSNPRWTVQWVDERSYKIELSGEVPAAEKTLFGLKFISDTIVLGGQHRRILWIEPNYLWRARPKISKGCSAGDWWIDRVDARSAWSTGHEGKRKIRVVVLDTGIDKDNPELAHSISRRPALNLVHYGWPTDQNGHGTMVAGLISAKHDMDETTGIAPGISVLSFKVLNWHRQGWSNRLARAIDRIVELNQRGPRIHIVNASLSLDTRSRRLYNSLKRLEAAGILLVLAAGNDEGRDLDTDPAYPASYRLSNFLTVGAADAEDQWMWSFGDRTVHLAAPGACLWVVTPNHSHGKESEPGLEHGTSLATALVSGAAALVFSRFPDWTAEQVKQRLLSSARAVPEFGLLAGSSAVLCLDGLFRPDGAPPPERPCAGDE